MKTHLLELRNTAVLEELHREREWHRLGTAPDLRHNNVDVLLPRLSGGAVRADDGTESRSTVCSAVGRLLARVVVGPDVALGLLSLLLEGPELLALIVGVDPGETVTDEESRDVLTVEEELGGE